MKTLLLSIIILFYLFIAYDFIFKPAQKIKGGLFFISAIIVLIILGYFYRSDCYAIGNATTLFCK